MMTIRGLSSAMAATLNIDSTSTLDLKGNSPGIFTIFGDVNNSGMMTMAHPIHVHDQQFQVLERRHGAVSGSVRDGYVDQGWKDTVLVMPGDRVKLLMRFADYPGLYLYHCHMLEHEDLGLMRNYRIEA